MPYAKNDQLPQQVRTALGHLLMAMTIWRNAFNSEAEDGLSEGDCAKRAWGAVKHLYEKGPNGKWETIRRNE